MWATGTKQGSAKQSRSRRPRPPNGATTTLTQGDVVAHLVSLESVGTHLLLLYVGGETYEARLGDFEIMLDSLVYDLGG